MPHPSLTLFHERAPVRAVRPEPQTSSVAPRLWEQAAAAFILFLLTGALIGPIFAARIKDWGPHLAQMKLFWSSVALSTGVYQGRPMPKHLPLPIDARHFDRWLEIFEATTHDLCPPLAADHFMERARRIAESLELGVANANGVLLGKGERYCGVFEGWAPDAEEPAGA